MENNGFVLINLLPYRQKLIAEKQKSLYTFLGFFLFAAISILVLGYTYLSLQLDDQEMINKYIEKENSRLDSQISEIANLKDAIKTTLAKRQVVESLQVDRSEGVQILNELSNKLPEGSMLENVKRIDSTITVVGLTQSSNKVSNYVSDLEKTDIFEKASILEVKSVFRKSNNNSRTKVSGEDVRVNQFTILLTLRKKINPDDINKYIK